MSTKHDVLLVLVDGGVCNGRVEAQTHQRALHLRRRRSMLSQLKIHELSPGGSQNISYLFKNLSKSRLSDPFFGLFLVISEVGSQIYSEFRDFQNLSVLSNFSA